MHNIKLKLLVGSAIQALFGAELLANPDLEDIDVVQHVRNYNSLPSVEENDAKLQSSPQFASFLTEAEEIVTRYELQSLVGLRLIHRHFTLGQNQVMAEEYKIVDKVPSLVTSAHLLENAKEIKATPASWIFSTQPQDVVQLFETSTDTAVKKGNTLLEKSPEFFEEMGAALRDHKLTDLLSLSVLKRDSLTPQHGQIFMEVNYADQAKSVVQLWNANKSTANFIRTTWSFKGPNETTCLRTHYCEADRNGDHRLWTIHFNK